MYGTGEQSAEMRRGRLRSDDFVLGLIRKQLSVCSFMSRGTAGTADLP